MCNYGRNQSSVSYWDAKSGVQCVHTASLLVKGDSLVLAVTSLQLYTTFSQSSRDSRPMNKKTLMIHNCTHTYHTLKTLLYTYHNGQDSTVQTYPHIQQSSRLYCTDIPTHTTIFKTLLYRRTHTYHNIQYATRLIQVHTHTYHKWHECWQRTLSIKYSVK